MMESAWAIFVLYPKEGEPRVSQRRRPMTANLFSGNTLGRIHRETASIMRIFRCRGGPNGRYGAG